MATVTKYPIRSKSRPSRATAGALVPAADVEVDDRRAGTPAACRAEQKFVTVLFADVAGSMALSESIGLEPWWSMMAMLFELMSEAVHRCGGWVGAFTGDGIKAVFESGGAEQHARRACQAAMLIRDAMWEPRVELRRERGLDLLVRVGVHSGDVLTGTVGGPHGRYHTACGYTVALAKRIEALATPDRIYVSEHTAALVGDRHQLHDRGVFDVKGAPFPVGVYELARRG